MTVFGAIILWRHDAKAMWAALGSVVNSILSVILKRILNQERPDSASRSDPGMPSSHGQSIFFTVVFAILSGNAPLYLTCLLFISQLGILGQQLLAKSKQRSFLGFLVDLKCKR
ncbi:PALMITOYL-PROTEIN THIOESTERASE/DOLICHYLDIPHOSPHATASE 1 [Salix viminalis]|uniref:PALMITOYL-PROTEIN THIOESTERASE/DOLICHYLDIPHOSPHATASE 1 n=1 Tax=Salix viminalis TaxID=40686 RepID=A0A9Q0NIB2_SALVM|nr:PALMITOYL-PROTEIN THIOESTERASE/DOLICHYLDIPHOSPHATASE 1 [Salix viminalis]